MKLLALHYFCTVVQEGSISKAAEKLFITQQSLSGYLARLEAEYNCSFFERQPRLRLTLNGERFFVFAQNVLRENDALKNSLDHKHAERIRLPVSISANYEQQLMPAISAEFKKRHPKVLLSIRNITRNLQQSMLQKMEIYCAIEAVGQKYAKIRSEKLMDNDVYVIIPNLFLSAHPSLLQLHELPLNQLADLPWILPSWNSILRAQINNYCLQKGISLNIVMESSNPNASFEYCAQNIGCCLLPRLTLYNFVVHTSGPLQCRYFPLDTSNEVIKNNPINLMYRTDIKLPAYAVDFIATAKQVCHAAERQITDLLHSRQAC
ncbi:MAG: LysR family transcriptional regulator [Lachnospiraceae bacterium]|nr:LysR family transcriptional regulator [Lachnospiraceae bacterium]